MNKPLRVLLLEDSVADAELVLHTLRRAGFAPSVSRVETEEDFLDQLQSPPDIILADFTMPEFDSLRTGAPARTPARRSLHHRFRDHR